MDTVDIQMQLMVVGALAGGGMASMPKWNRTA
jgi:hypothetical protein